MHNNYYYTMNQKNMPARVSFNDVNIFFIYTFDLDKEVDEVDVVHQAQSLYKKSIARAFLNEKTGKIICRDNVDTKLSEFKRYDQRYFHQDYLSLGRFVRLELPGFTIFFSRNKKAKVDVYLSLHSIGIGSIMFMISGIQRVSTEELVGLEISTSNEIELTLPNLVQRFLEKTSDGHQPERKRTKCTINKIFESYLIALAEAGLSVEGFDRSTLKISSLDPNAYVVCFILDTMPRYATPDEFVASHKNDIIDILETRPYYGNLSYHVTRKTSYIDSVTTASPPQSRKHVWYSITPERMVHVSTVKKHAYLYPYESADWFLHEVTIVEILRVQYRLLSRLNKILYFWTKTDPLELAKLKKKVLKGLEEYHVIRFPRYYLTRRFATRLKVHMELDTLYQELIQKLEIMSDLIESIHSIETERKVDATTVAVDILTLVISGPVAFELVDRFIEIKEIWMYLLVWVIIGAIFFGIKRILIALYKLRLAQML